VIAAAVLALSGIEKSFGPVAVLRGVDLEVCAGEVHAVLGENGAGKSTLMRILLGIEHAERGAMKLAGKPYLPDGPADARRAGIVMVPQERTLCPHLDVVENIVLGIEPAVRSAP
jgi:ribose transport system ATP-binding protein